ncbi:hypothetical protein HMPREF0765_3952 [Sphingobacterium spiritivorum ATCC 33300]|uniref:Uncharacterized protein n=2 Tax=Sphingobacterium spiritivorum TaxID=258 RepID=D7VSU7_SPHSI|nr:hypothetical protein HMPREF0765_3952 [Sphingobacterium spiritivorum ATCC 33300]EFK56848.1 hypothetical protein HMPREF0766_14051 [Sphingobacterium spiritivorum ATCC 33861]
MKQKYFFNKLYQFKKFVFFVALFVKTTIDDFLQQAIITM